MTPRFRSAGQPFISGSAHADPAGILGMAAAKVALAAAVLAAPLALSACGAIPTVESLVDAAAAGDKAAIGLFHRGIERYCGLPEPVRLRVRSHLGTARGPVLEAHCENL